MYLELSKLKILKCKRTHCERLPGKRMYSTERRTEKNFCLFSYSSSSSFIVRSRGRDQEEWIKRNGSRGTDQEERIKRNRSRGMDQRQIYRELSTLTKLKFKRTHCEWLPGKRMYSTERRTEKNFCLFSYSSSSSFIVHPMLDQVRPGHIESSRSIRYL